MALNTLLAVAGVAVLRSKQPDLIRPFRVPLYPWPMLIYVGITLWTLLFVLWQRPLEGVVAAALLSVGWLFYCLRPKIG